MATPLREERVTLTSSGFVRCHLNTPCRDGTTPIVMEPLELVARRITRAHGWQRTGARIQARVDDVAARSHCKSNEGVGTFCWAKSRGPEIPVKFRRSSDAASRVVDGICMPELASLAREIAESGHSGDAAVVAIARELGLQRLRTTGRGRIEAAIALSSG